MSYNFTIQRESASSIFTPEFIIKANNILTWLDTVHRNYHRPLTSADRVDHNNNLGGDSLVQNNNELEGQEDSIRHNQDLAETKSQ